MDSKEINKEINKEVELEQIGIIVKIPKNTARIVINCSLVNDENGIDVVSCVLNADEIRERRQDFINYVGTDDYDAIYELTPEGREWLEDYIKNK